MSCNRVFNVPGCPGDMQRIAPEGFVVERHEMTLYGVCSDCHQNVQ
jgi:Fur family ferric uptake transcriptional regulator